ncbi:MAG TPA: hypothetical protein VGM66_11240 [Candidatus Udaeobacter sp.]|jgi:hypothetical protein
MIVRLIVILCVSLFLVSVLPLLVFGQLQHPVPLRQPTIQVPPATTTSSPQVNTLTREVSKADISAGIKSHINNERRRAADKKFHINYRGRNLALDLIKVHDDRLANVGGGKYFACVDMKGADGKIYDIDFFMTGQPGSMSVTETSVHKINGKPLYNWKEQGGVWKKVRVS